jgi:hypothetical protein
MPTRPPARQRPHGYPTADHQLSNEEVVERYGELIARFFVGLRQDGHLLADIAAGAAAVAKRQKTQRENQTRYQQHKAEREIMQSASTPQPKIASDRQTHA